jgi:hypothetical protein
MISCEKNVYEKPIDSDILLEVVEKSGSVHLLAETVKEYGCLGYIIDYSQRRLGSNITIKFKYIEEPDGCLTAIGPATCDINLGELDNGEYSIKFKLNGETSEGEILSDPLRLEISESGNVKLKK